MVICVFLLKMVVGSWIQYRHIIMRQTERPIEHLLLAVRNLSHPLSFSISPQSVAKLKDSVRKQTKWCNAHAMGVIVRKINSRLGGWFAPFRQAHLNVHRNLDGECVCAYARSTGNENEVLPVTLKSDGQALQLGETGCWNGDAVEPGFEFPRFHGMAEAIEAGAVAVLRKEKQALRFRAAIDDPSLGAQVGERAEFVGFVHDQDS